MTFWWHRAVPAVTKAGDVGGDSQVGEAYETRWWWPLADGSGFATMSRYFYVAERDGHRFVESHTEYNACRDWADPGSTELWSGQSTYTECDGDPTDGEAYGMAERGERPYGESEWVVAAPVGRCWHDRLHAHPVPGRLDLRLPVAAHPGPVGADARRGGRG